MKGLICYYSGSGNTKLACEYIARKTREIDFDLFDIVRDGEPDFDSRDIVGFATFTDFFGPPMRMKTFIRSLPMQPERPAFLFNTYGSTGGKTLEFLDRWSSGKGFRTVASHGLHAPENYPPLIARGMAFADAPSEKELAAFRRFVAELDAIAGGLSTGKSIRHQRPQIGLFRFLPAPPRKLARRMMGEKSVDIELCTECAVCRSVCPYGAIDLNPKPLFDRTKCCGCWACYNHCPTKAIYTKKIRGVGHYPKPNAALTEKLGG